MNIRSLSAILFSLGVFGCTSTYVVSVKPGSVPVAALEHSIGESLTASNFAEDPKLLASLRGGVGSLDSVWIEQGDEEKEGHLLAFVYREKERVIVRLVPQTYGAKKEAEARGKLVAARVESALRGQDVVVQVDEERGPDFR